ncbi:sulfotransferase family 2 domain-containing protein [Pseudoponticoccus marisrubri]|uniref:Sulfotransferase family protein n=1 Tax=Pseudoponticoccus marisrubri TaxID=1685382 RepID=A0A0W7WM27_9RHOB|nr:sulfotransferase family 2 domain-containing protein [Pseudoponticoccus marisrubri]KUF11591.1 hypothetical protein AVJ23_07490 [Pseudoponticoccus marisrubri]
MVITVDAHKLAYMALPKAGCSSVKEALARLDPSVTLPPEDQIDVRTWHGIYPTRRFRKHRWRALEGYWGFCVVRDPVKRLLSVYTNRVLQFGDTMNSRKLRQGRDWLPDLPRQPDPDTFFQNLQGYVMGSSSIKHHVMGARVFLGPDLGVYDKVYRTEELGQLAYDLALLTRQNVHMPRGNRSEAQLTLDDLAPRTIDALRPMLDEEYAFLSDYYDNPLGPRRHDACVTPMRRVS